MIRNDKLSRLNGVIVAHTCATGVPHAPKNLMKKYSCNY